MSDLPHVTEATPDMVGKKFLVVGQGNPSVIDFNSLTTAEHLVQEFLVYGPIRDPQEEAWSVVKLREELATAHRIALKSLHDLNPKATARTLKTILDRWPEDKGDVSDGYHTFNELYAHRFALFCALVRMAAKERPELCWMSKLHHDGTMLDGDYFIAGIGREPGNQISYHWKIERCWAALQMAGCTVLDRAPEWDGHTAQDAVQRLVRLGTRTSIDARA